MLDDEDITETAEIMSPGAIGAILVYENTWAAPFATALRKAGAQLIANGRIPVNALIAALETKNRRTPDAWFDPRSCPHRRDRRYRHSGVQWRVPAPVRPMGEEGCSAGGPAARQLQPAPAPAAPAPAAETMDDKIAALKQLGELHAQGILTDEEFAAQKAKLLG